MEEQISLCPARSGGIDELAGDARVPEDHREDGPVADGDRVGRICPDGLLLGEETMMEWRLTSSFQTYWLNYLLRPVHRCELGGGRVFVRVLWWHKIYKKMETI